MFLLCVSLCLLILHVKLLELKIVYLESIYIIDLIKNKYGNKYTATNNENDDKIIIDTADKDAKNIRFKQAHAYAQTQLYK